MNIEKFLSTLNSTNQVIIKSVDSFCNNVGQNKTPLLPYKDKISSYANQIRNQLPAQATKLYILLSEIYLSDSEQFLAAKSLLLINFNSDQCGLSQTQRIDNMLKICQYCIEVQDNITCFDTYSKLKKINFNALENSNDEQSLYFKMRYELVDAQFLKDNGRYVDAGLLYYQVIGYPILRNYPQQLLKIIDSSIICLLLSSNNAKRTRLLSSLYQDQKRKSSKLSDYVDKLLFGTLITKQQANSLSEKLKKNQNKQDEDGVTPLQRTIFEHNVICLIKIFEAISFNSLITILNMPINKIMDFLQKMVISNRIQAQIDQVNGYVVFTQNQASIIEYNKRITNFCESLQQFIEQNKPK